MLFGVTFPQTEIGADPVAIRDYAQAVTDLGYSHIVAGEHVLSPGYTHPKEVAPYRASFHEPFALFGYLAALTPLELLPSVIILPQRQTVLVAKQAMDGASYQAAFLIAKPSFQFPFPFVRSSAYLRCVLYSLAGCFQSYSHLLHI